jgi:CheY-like chemotaxis protein
LSLVKQLTELHGGNVEVESTGEGQGATLTVTLPMHAVHQGGPDKESREQIKEAVRSAAHRLDGLRILIVDDDDTAGEMLSVSLQESGATTSFAASSSAADGRIGGITAIRERQPAL